MNYTMLLWPHANVRYRNETVRLASAEASVLLSRTAEEISVTEAELNGLPALELSTECPLSVAAEEALARHSLMYGLFRHSEADGALYPICGREEPLVGEDLPGVLKYKGKTNELFTHMLVNLALYASDFSEERQISLYDPMCGRGTTLFDGLNRGWSCTGSDVDRADLKEAEQFLKRYLEFHRRKHSMSRSSLTRQGNRPASCVGFTLPELPSAALRLAETDATLVRETFGARKAHLVVSDLPYGVQHGPNGGSLESLLRRALPNWRELLRPGGAVALSFNVHTLPRRLLLELMTEAGLETVDTGAYTQLEHWVEQAVTRDVVVGIRRK